MQQSLLPKACKAKGAAEGIQGGCAFYRHRRRATQAPLSKAVPWPALATGIPAAEVPPADALAPLVAPPLHPLPPVLPRLLFRPSPGHWPRVSPLLSPSPPRRLLEARGRVARDIVRTGLMRLPYCPEVAGLAGAPVACPPSSWLPPAPPPPPLQPRLPHPPHPPRQPRPPRPAPPPLSPRESKGALAAAPAYRLAAQPPASIGSVRTG